MEDHLVVFLPAGRRGRVTASTSVLDAARALGVDLDSICGGRGICGRCQVEVGTAPGIGSISHALSAPGPTEIDYRGRRPLAAGRRLGCAARIYGDVVISVPPDSHVHRQVVRKRPEVGALPVDPVVRLHYVEVAPPELGGAEGDLRRLLAALDREWGLRGLTVDHHLLAGLQGVLREGKWAVTVAVRGGADLIAIWPGFRDLALGAAFDIGSTTIAGHLCDLASGQVLASEGVMNPQIRFGEDLMSRVSYVMMHEGGAAELTRLVREALDSLLGELVEAAGFLREDVLEVTLVGNPIMHHLLLGIDPRELGTAPFTLAVDQAVQTTTGEIGLSAHRGARVYALPCIAGHVGADTAGAILSEGPHRGDAIQLLVDVGTNAEAVLGNSSRLLAASSPTGPAFEGAQISSGQRAAPGAIERVRIDRHTLEPRFKLIGIEGWSDEPGFSGRPTGICGSGIIEAIAEMYLCGLVTSEGVISGERGSDRLITEGRTLSYRLHENVLITQTDVRAIQLAKAALYAGVRLLMDHLQVERPDEIRLAGAFGAQIDPYYAQVLGLIPECGRVFSAGNAAGTGAMMALLSEAARKEIEEVVKRVEKVETALEPRFQEHFVAAMGIPHGSTEAPRRRRTRGAVS
jgi:uncharacterized 2Fe-2S/4Fe-4S cluster protein (DUF4445 family)